MYPYWRGIIYYETYLSDTVKQLKTNVHKGLELMANVSQTLRVLEFFFLQLVLDFIKIWQGLDVTSIGKLSAGFLPPHNVSRIVQQVALSLLNDAILIAGTDVEDMFM
jgi:hypothetical protein